MPITQKREVLTIGIFGSNGKTSTANILASIFNWVDIHVEIINNEKNDVYKRNMTNIDVYKKLKSDGSSDIIIIELDEDFLKDNELESINFNILIHCHISEDSYENSEEGKNKINSIISSSMGIKAIILNTDDANWKDIVIDIENTYLITYGLGNKATVTASSIECSRDIRFCYCLQRSLTNFKNTIVEPMETPFLVKALGQYNVYNSLAAITAALVYGIDIDRIITSLCSTIPHHAGVKMVYENGFGVIDNVCNNLLSFESGFEAIQNLPYENIQLIFNLSHGNSQITNNKIVEIIGLWALTLKIKDLYFINADGTISRLRYYTNLFKDLMSSGFNILQAEGMITDVEEIVNSLNEKDMLLFFCSSEFDPVREKISEILDRRILGHLSGYTA